MEGFILIGLVVFMIWCLARDKGSGEVSPQQSAKSAMEKNMICPNCQTKGSVTTKKVKQKVGVSGGKATAALLTCGISLLGTGLSRKQEMTQANCSNCGSVYTF